MAGEDRINFVYGECMSMISHRSRCESLSGALPPAACTAVCTCRRWSRLREDNVRCRLIEGI